MLRIFFIRSAALPITYLVTSPTKFSSGPPLPPRPTPPRIRDGSSAPSTIASTPRRRASSTIAYPARRVRTVAVATYTPPYSSPTAFARASARRASLICSSGRRASSGSDIGITKIQTASIVAVSIVASSVGSPAASMAAVCTMSSSSLVPNSGTRIDP